MNGRTRIPRRLGDASLSQLVKAQQANQESLNDLITDLYQAGDTLGLHMLSSALEQTCRELAQPRQKDER